MFPSKEFFVILESRILNIATHFDDDSNVVYSKLAIQVELKEKQSARDSLVSQQ